MLKMILILAWNLSEESDKLVYRKRISSWTYTALPELPSMSSLPDYQETFNEISSRTSKIIPIALALIKTQTTNVSDKLKFLFDFSWNWLPNVYNHNYVTNNIKSSLSADEYQNVLQHINEYIETVVTKKIKSFEEDLSKREQKIDPNVAAYIANIVNQQIIQYKYELSDADVERIAEIVRLKLTVEIDERLKSLPIVLSQANLEEISKVVKQNIEIHRHEWTVAAKSEKLVHESVPQPHFDVDEIVYKILTSSKLHDVIDQRVDGKISKIEIKFADSVDQLQNEMNELKEKLKTLFASDGETKISLGTLSQRQSELSEGLVNVESQNNANFEKLLSEIDIKLNALNDKQFAAIDSHVRSVLIDILGYKSADGKPIENVDITNWIRNVFVAKDMLEIRLNELNEKFDRKLNDEINQSAGILIKDISEKIKQEIVVAIKKHDQGVLSGGVNVEKNLSLDERRISEMIREALAVYDADKTGMVDYALESSGGEVLSTR